MHNNKSVGKEIKLAFTEEQLKEQQDFDEKTSEMFFEGNLLEAKELLRGINQLVDTRVY